MTEDEFFNFPIPIKLNFRQKEAVRHVLCNGMPLNMAAQIMDVPVDELKKIIQLFQNVN